MSAEDAGNACSSQCSIVLSIKEAISNLNYLCSQQQRLLVFLMILYKEYVFCACQNSDHPCLLSRKDRLSSFGLSQEATSLICVLTSELSDSQSYILLKTASPEMGTVIPLGSPVSS